jgi:menaquinone-dependent protoporphyrinogen IX oxidase
MKGKVVYHSRWGSCKKIAESIAGGLNDSGHDAMAIAVEDAGEPDPSLDFIVIGGSTRAARASGKVKRYADKVIQTYSTGKPFATFSTGGAVRNGKLMNRQASEQLQEMLLEGGLAPLAPPFKGIVEGYKILGSMISHENRGRVTQSEAARAEDFGRELGTKLSSQ